MPFSFWCNVYTARAIADLFHCSISNIYALWATGALAHVCVGRKKGKRSTPEQVREFLEQRTKGKEPPRRTAPVKDI